MSGALLALAEQCENATKPDRELDFAICSLVAGLAKYNRLTDEYDAPYLSKSMDAATSAFTDGAMYRSGHDGEGPDPSMFACQVVTNAPFCRSVRTVAHTEPLARLSAALRARAQQEAAS